MNTSSPTSRKQSPWFITAELDDFGVERDKNKVVSSLLPPYEFRLLCHIVRRGSCWESIPNMAKHCRMSKDRAWQAVRRLVELRLITKIEGKNGRSNTYMANTPTHQGNGTGSKHNPSGKRDAHPPRIRDTYPSGKRDTKVIPKGSKKKGDSKSSSDVDWEGAWA